MIIRLSWKCALVVGAAVVVVAALVAVAVLRPWEAPPLRFPTAAVASNGYECAEIGRDILLKNGSAADAAIATLFCEGVSCAQCMGLGGGFLMTVYDSNNSTMYALNAREVAPAATSHNMFSNASSTVGGLAVAVPGELRGYGELHSKFGRLPWAQLVQPTADLCRRGHHVTEYMARSLLQFQEVIKNEPSLREVYINESTGEVYKEGDLIVRPDLARTLDIIASEGPDAMHQGSLTEGLVADIQSFGGIITVQDMNNYRPTWQEPVKVRLSESHNLYTTPLPGSGAVLAFILNMLDGWIGTDEAPLNSPLYWQRAIETFKFAYAKRTGLGDPPRETLHFDINELVQNLTNADWAKSFRSLVSDSKTSNDWRDYGAMFDPADDHGTAQVSVVAPDGSAISVTSTVNYIWGCQRISPSTGVVLNNEMDDFAVPDRISTYGMPASPANLLEPGKHPLSSMVPVVVLDENERRPSMVLGAAGGTKITTQVAIAVRAVMIEKEFFPTVIRRPRIHHQLFPMEIQYEEDFDRDVITSLETKGHATTALSPTAGFAAVVGIHRDTDGYLPQYDTRRIGSVAGY